MATSEKSGLIAAGKRPEAEGKQLQEFPAVHSEHHNSSHHHNQHHHHQSSARILHHWVHQFEKINASLDEHGQPIGQDGNRHGGKNSGSNGPAKERNKSREGKDGNADEEDEEAGAEEEVEEDEEDDEELCFKATQLVTELLLMLFAASLLIIAAVVIFSKNIPAFMKSYEIVPMFLFLMCILVASVSFTRWLVSKVRTKFGQTTFHPDVSQLLAEQKLVLPDGVRPVGSPKKLVESIISGPTSILVTVSNFRATVSDNLVSAAPATSFGAGPAMASYGKSGYNGGGIHNDTTRTSSSTSANTTPSSGFSSNNARGNILTSTSAATVSSYIDGKCRASLTKSNLINDSMTSTIDEESNSLTEFA